MKVSFPCSLKGVISPMFHWISTGISCFFESPLDLGRGVDYFCTLGTGMAGCSSLFFHCQVSLPKDKLPIPGVLLASGFQYFTNLGSKPYFSLGSKPHKTNFFAVALAGWETEFFIVSLC